jgi:hypothetical protein
MDPFHIEPLANGLTVEFFDSSNRYFGAYWRLCLEVHCQIDVAGILSGAELEKARSALGASVDFNRRLVRMGVAEDDLLTVRQEMVESFLASARAYLEKPAFPARLIASRLMEKNRPRLSLVSRGH